MEDPEAEFWTSTTKKPSTNHQVVSTAEAVKRNTTKTQTDKHMR